MPYGEQGELRGRPADRVSELRAEIGRLHGRIGELHRIIGEARQWLVDHAEISGKGAVKILDSAIPKESS